MPKKRLRFLGPVLVLLIFSGAIWLLYMQLRQGEMSRVVLRLKEVISTHPWSLVAALALTAINYVILVGYDLLAIRFVGEKLPLRRVALASFTAYTVGYNFGSTFGGTAVRYRLYSAWGVPPVKILQLLVILAFTFWFGMLALAGVVFIAAPLPMPAILQHWLQHYLHFPETWANTRPFGVILLGIALIYVGLAAAHRGSIKLWRWRLPVPPFKLTLYQIGIASADLLLVAAVLYTLWPARAHSSYLTVLGIYMLVFVVGVLTHVPGGYGVMEAVMLTLISDSHARASVIASWLLFRAIYYILPLLVSVSLLFWYELRLGKEGRRQLHRRPPPPTEQASSPPPSPDA